MTLFELVIRSMRKNMKHYYLYFFALISSTALYFVFASLQHDTSIMAATFGDVQFASLFKVSGMLLLAIVVIFMLQANSIFLGRRSREIGLYQLVGLTRRGVLLLLVAENMLLGIGALLLGIGAGALASRLFVLILMKLIGIESVITLSFSNSAAIQTAIVFAVLIGLTWIQIVFKVYCTTLLGLFKADRQGEHPKQPKAVLSAMMGLLSIVLIGAGYMLSSKLPGQELFLQMLVILASTILGTYLLFRVTIGWLLYWVRRSKNGQLGLKNSLSLAPVMHRMKANASSLTLITVLSAMTLTMVAIAYSLYYSAESEARGMLPYDFIFENNGQDARSFRTELEQAEFTFIHQSVEAIRLTGAFGNGKEGERSLLLLAAEQLQASGADIELPKQGEAVWFKGQRNALSKEPDTVLFPQAVNLEASGVPLTIKVIKGIDRYAMNYNVNGGQLAVPEATLHAIREQIPSSTNQATIQIDTYQIASKNERAVASGFYAKYVKADENRPDFDTYYKESLQKFGLIIFIAGFLGLIFLMATGSILYFKQMTEAEQERKSYTILRQLGFGEQEIMGGIIRKQLFVFTIPLAIGLVHSIVAVKAASALTLSDITFPAAAAMAMYTVIYFVFAVLAVGYYRRIVRLAL
ncbi:bacitracin transport system permease protein [Paenibacillus algorifonticola]|uniref:Bacitracin transport system permease protein n=1 Tax=Paenibacillus algorifonticola TaxID=684063 RepID=A0A1I2ENT7_9BACL|nr:FtsX-like permease family protein [Paenibacillus algorifonticola]SFE94011.1 bacitracin transport system permease protein [Paenibacillus algorifonticola]